MNKEEIDRAAKIYPRQRKVETLHSKLMKCGKTSSKREVYNNKAYIKKKEKFQINNLMLCFKELEKEEEN